jgi:hypothetical protein
MKKTLLFWCCFVFSIFLVSCSKTDNDVYVLPEQDYTAVKQRFYNMNDNVDIEVLKIVNDIRKHDSVMRFLPSFVAKHGYPVWDKVMFAVIDGNNQRTSEQGNVTTNSTNSRTGSTTSSQGVFFIPMENETNTAVKSYITVYKHNDTLYNYRLYDRNDLNTLTPTNDSTKKKLLATQAVFGHFEKQLYNRDSISINAPSSTVIKKAKLRFGTQNANIGGRDVNPQPCVKHVIMFLVVDNVNVGFIIVDVPCPDGGGSGGNGSYSWGGTYCWNCSPGGTNGGNNGGTTNGGGNGGTNWTNLGTGGYGWGGANWGDPGGSSYTGGSGGSGNGNGGSSNQGFSSGYWWTGYSSLSYDYLIPQLTVQLSLIPVQSYWLELNMPRAIEISNYLQTSLDPDKDQKAKKHLERMMVEPQYATFLENYSQQTNYSGKIWWQDEVFLAPFGGMSFGFWASQYLIQNPNISFSAFKIQFLKKNEGVDGSYNSSYWDDPNLSFTPETLPSFSSFEQSYPKHDDPLYDTPEKMYSSIGGQVQNLYNSDPSSYQNTCALRISKALNNSGISIPAGTDRYQGADGKYYFISAMALFKWMKKKFGTPSGSNHLNGAQGGTNGENFPTLLAGKKGIYIMIPNYPGGCANGTGFCASGHADMINDSLCDGGCYFNATGGVSEIFIWELQ